MSVVPTTSSPATTPRPVRTTSPSPRADGATTVVASVPGSHVYVRHVADEQPDGVVRLADPDPDDPTRTTTQRWWPPVMLSPEWVAQADLDVFHVQFGFDSWEPARLEAVAEAVHARGARLVHTVHDLRNPHHTDPALHDAQLRVLLAHADEVVTLTHGAAAEIERRYGRRATVIPHPHVVELDTMASYAARPRPAGPFRIGLHVKSLRASLAPEVVLPVLVEAVAALPDAVLQVNGHRDVLEGGHERHDPALAAELRRLDAAGAIELHVHDYLTDAELWDYLHGLDASVLAYRFGTHSGWLEACRDLGTAVVAPTCGFYAEQGAVHSFDLDEDRFDADSLVAAVRAAHAAGPVAPVTVADRRRQRAAVAAAHREVYGHAGHAS
ncbi:glycosyltransferase [Nocardioides aurantiacus]|uniref:Glycosyl transferase family 4 n=1 Tax=Nocardioides aurantiacus TaxID=86796 RepID=A0A3N2CVP1_9ACTN|nr:glycosyltransferase [Nocardioides aurantiacus]ROR91559.1 glycosyl transferase family 4 [Nocardioides aurantiacus]